MFQDYLLFPHLTVLDNVAFGLRARGAPRARPGAAAQAWVDRVGLADLAGPGRRPSPADRPSGWRWPGRWPPIPGSCCSTSRWRRSTPGPAATVRRDLRHHLADFDGATVLVTHDPLDALALADRVVVLEEGRVTQAGTIGEVTSRPRTPYVAELIGVNLLRGDGDGHRVRLDGDATVTVADAVDGPTLLVVRPQAVALHTIAAGDERPQPVARATSPGSTCSATTCGCASPATVDLVADVTPAAVADLGLVEGGSVWASVKATEVTAYPE